MAWRPMWTWTTTKDHPVHSNSWTNACAGKTVKSLDNACHTWALLQWGAFTKGRYIKCMTFTFFLRLKPNRKSGQSNLAKAVWNLWGKSGPVPRVLKSLHPKQDLDPFKRFCTAKPRETAWQTDWRTPVIIDLISPHLVHSMRPRDSRNPEIEK